MAEQLPNLRRGRIVWVSVKDRNGFEKVRPAIVLTRTEAITEDALFEVMAITTSFPDPAPVNYVALPWQRPAHPITRLGERSAAVLNWLDRVSAASVKSYAGDVPRKLMRYILDRLNRSEDGFNV